MKATIIYDNTVFRDDLQADWGFAALIETDGKRILFDTGGRGSILLSNMRKLNIDAQRIDDVFISHAHYDHTGGLSAFLDLNNDVTVWTPPSFKGVKNVRQVNALDHPETLAEGIFSTGELAGIEQSLCLETARGIVIVAGCSHPPMAQIVQAASSFGKVYGIIGGLHGNSAEALGPFHFICATHCTQHKQEIMALYPERYVPGGAGRAIDLTGMDLSGG